MRVPARQRRILAVAQRAVQLDGGIHHLVHHVRQEHLGDAVFLPQVHALFRLVGDVQQHQPRHVKFAGAFGEHELHALPVAQSLPERLALRHMRRRQIERALRHRHIVHAVPQPPIGQPVLPHVETIAFAAEQIFRRHHQILDLDLAVAAAHHLGKRAFDGHRLDVALDDIAGVGQLDDEGGKLAVARRIRIGARHHHGQIGGAGGGREPLLPVHDIIAVAVLHRGGAHAGGIGARGLLGHRIADALFAVQEGFQIFLLLKLRPMRQQGEHRRIIRPLAVHRQRTKVALPQLHLHQRVGERAQPHAAMFLGNERQPQALRPRLGPQRVQHGLVISAFVQLLFRRPAFIIHPLPNPFANGLGFGWNLEIDRHGDGLPGGFSVGSLLGRHRPATYHLSPWKRGMPRDTTPS